MDYVEHLAKGRVPSPKLKLSSDPNEHVATIEIVLMLDMDAKA